MLGKLHLGAKPFTLQGKEVVVLVGIRLPG